MKYLLLVLLAFCACRPATQQKIEEKITSIDTIKKPKTKLDEMVEKSKDSITVKKWDTAQARKAWADYATVGPFQKMLREQAGAWKDELTFYMGKDSIVSKGTTTIKSTLGGLFQESEHRGAVSGSPYEGKAIIGYNNARKKFEYFWIDNQGSGSQFANGVYDPIGHRIVLDGKGTDPLSAEDKPFRETIRFIDNKNMLLEIFDTENGTEKQTVRIKRVRTK